MISKTRFLVVLAGFGVTAFSVLGRHVGGSAPILPPGDVRQTQEKLTGVARISPRPTLWQLREPLPAPRMRFDPDAPIVDVAAEAGMTPPGQDDLDPTIDVLITQEIIDKANELGTPGAMYEFVRNECVFQAYYGSQKGSVETLRQRAGNDYDLASLLIALLRASDIPARYALGMVEMDTEEVNGWLAVDDGTVAGSILFTHGMEGIILVDGGGNVVAVRARRVWVEAYVPHGYGSPTWVPLDPAFSSNTIHEGIDIPEEMGLDVQAFVDEYYDPSDPSVILPRPETVLELLLQQEIVGYLDVNYPELTLTDIMRTHEIVPENLGVLPGSLPYTVRSRDMEFAEIPAARRYQIRFHLHDGGTHLIDHTVNLPEIAGKRITIDYVACARADQEIIDAAGGIYAIPDNEIANVDLKPVVRLDGQDLAVSTNCVGMGLVHQSDIHFLAPVNQQGMPQNVVPAIYNVIVCGASQAIGIAIEGVSEGLLNPPPADDTEGMASLLYDTAMDYLARGRSANVELGRLMHAYVTTGVANAIVQNVVKVTYSGGVPQSFDWVGLLVDADRSVLGYWPVENYNPPDPESKDFLIVAGAEGSLNENLIYEDSYGQDAVSTIKILQLCSDAGITIYHRWSSTNLPANTQPSHVRTAIQNAIAIGHVVTFPADPITAGTPATGEWTGTGWIDMDPNNGAAGYIISGNNNGGATVEYWPPEFIDLQEGDRDVTNVEIEITSPANDSPDPPAVFTRDNEQHLEFEYLVHVDYDDGSSATLGPYNRTTQNTTKTFLPGNYEFHVWISRSPWWGLLAEAERKVSIVGVLIRKDDGSPFGKAPPKLLQIKPPAENLCTEPIMALVLPETAPDGSPMASGFQWSGDPLVAFDNPTAQNTNIKPAGQQPSADLDDQEVNVVVNLPGGKQANGFAKLVLAFGGEDVKHKLTVVKLEITDTPANWIPEGRAYGTNDGDPGNSVTYDVTVTPEAARVCFTLEGVSSEPGVCMNYGGESGATPDLKFIQTGTVNPATDFNAPAANGLSIKTKNKIGQVTVTVTCYDWGAWGKIKACLVQENGVDCGDCCVEKDIPVDELPASGNHIADSWTAAHASEAALWDDDAAPANMARNGDGYSFYEEYRGAMQGFVGSHARLDPTCKDLFIYDEDLLHLDGHNDHKFIFVTLMDIQYVNADPNAMMNGPGLAAGGHRHINHKSEFGKIANQYALHMKKFNLVGVANWGLVDGPTLGPPKTADPLVKVDAAQIATDFSAAVTEQGGNPAGGEQAAYENVRDRMITVTGTHEMGHGCARGHHNCAAGGRQSPYTAPHCGDVACAMRYAFDLLDSVRRTSIRNNAELANGAGFILTDAGADFVNWGVTVGSDTVSIGAGTGATAGTYSITAVTATTITLGADAGDSGGTTDVVYQINTTHANLWGHRTADQSPAGTMPARFEFSKYTNKDLSDFLPAANIFCTQDNNCRGSLDVKDNP